MVLGQRGEGGEKKKKMALRSRAHRLASLQVRNVRRSFGTSKSSFTNANYDNGDNGDNGDVEWNPESDAPWPKIGWSPGSFGVRALRPSRKRRPGEAVGRTKPKKTEEDFWLEANAYGLDRGKETKKEEWPVAMFSDGAAKSGDKPEQHDEEGATTTSSSMETSTEGMVVYHQSRFVYDAERKDEVVALCEHVCFPRLGGMEGFLGAQLLLSTRDKPSAAVICTTWSSGAVMDEALSDSPFRAVEHLLEPAAERGETFNIHAQTRA